MKKYFIIVGLLFFALSSFSQNNNHIGNEITAEGYAKTKVKPDIAIFRITVEKSDFVEKIAIKQLNEEVDKFQKLFTKLGFSEKNIKISDYNISNTENNDGKKEYTAHNTLVVEFLLDNKIIEAFYQEIQDQNIADSDVEFETQISENLEKATRQVLLKKAIVEAQSNAENIASALDVKLTAVKQVSKYSMRDFAVEAASYKSSDNIKFDKPKLAAYKNPNTSFDKLEVEEKELDETITIVYEIVKK